MFQIPGYEITKILKQGKSSIVYLAKKMDNNEYVVLKTLLNNSVVDRRQILQREYEILQQFDSKHIEKVIEYRDNDTNKVLILEHVKGIRLKKIILGQHYSMEDRLLIAHQLIQAIEIVHNQKIIHKDINPNNIIWNPELKNLTLLDFNIAERIASKKVGIVNKMQLQGTLAYISPEQTGRINRFLDYRSDYYAIGVTLYELFTGRLPYEQEDFLEIIHSHIAVTPIEPHKVDGSIPISLSRIIMKLLEKNAEDRYQTLHGLLRDVQKVIKGETIEELDAFDHITEFMLSQKVYGREATVKSITQQFEVVCDDSSDYIFISGYSGVGKTTLIRELIPVVTQRYGYFLNGKYDQYSIDVPYSGIKGVIEEFIKYMYTEEETYIEAWNKNLLEEIGELGGVLLEFIPELEEIIGEQPEYPKLSGMEARNRFDFVMKKFIEAMNFENRPIVIFLDDLQWIDSASINFINELMENKDLKNTLFIGAYRMNEITSNHMLQLFFNNLNEKGLKYTEYEIQGLEFADILTMLKDSGFKNDNLQEVVSKLYQKTNGNPYYLHQILGYLYKNEDITREKSSGLWKIDDECLLQLQVAENVAEFIKAQLVDLSSKKVKVLKYASCIGNVFQRHMITSITEQDQEELNNILMDLIEYYFIQELSDNQFMFAHDQVQQAAYQLTTDAERVEIHSVIANELINMGALHGENTKIYELTRHVKEGMTSTIIQLDINQKVDLFLKTADIGLSNRAYVESDTILRMILDHLGTNPFTRMYEKSLEIYNRLIEIAYMRGEFEVIDSLVSVLKDNVLDSLHLATAYEIEVQSLMARQAYARGLEVAIKGLISIGIEVNVEFTEVDTARSFEKLQEKLMNRRPMDLINLKTMSDEYIVDSMKMITAVMPLFFNMAPQLLAPITIEMIIRSIDYGNCKYSSFAYSFMGTLLCGALRDYETGIEYGELSVALIDKLNAESEIPKTYMLTSQHVFQFRDHLDKVLKMEEIAYYKGIATGDLTYAGFAGHGYCYNTYLAGYNLKNTLKVFKNYTESLEQIKQGTQNLFQYIYMEAISNLIYADKKFIVLNGEWFNEFDELPKMKEQQHMTGLMVYYFNKTELAFIFNEYELALEYVEELKLYLDGGVGLMQSTIYYQYASLIRLQLMATYSNHKREHEMEIIKANQEILFELKESVNYGHRYLIVEAEIARINKEYDKARHIYEKAISYVNQYKYHKEESIYRELASQFYMEVGQVELSRYYGKTARHSYLLWGANAKAQQIMQVNSVLFDSEKGETIFTLQTEDTEMTTNMQVELSTILKFSREITKSIKYEELLKTLLYILLENAGATRAVVINYSKDSQLIVAENDVENGYRLETVQTLLEVERVPIQMINYVSHGKKVVRLDDINNSILFSQDPYYIANEVKSVLCYPIINKGEVIGIIYMENSLLNGVFLPERTRLLMLLSAQIAISLENALIYEHMENLVEERTKALQIKNDELSHLNNMLHHLSTTDTLTKLHNRRYLDDMLEIEVERVRQEKLPLSVILFDIDFFKKVNDEFGHHIGDEVLVHLAEVLKKSVPSTNIIGRWGGEEFLVICPEVGVKESVRLAERIRQSVYSAKYGNVGRKSVSIGVAEIKEGEETKSLLTRVDEKLYMAKKNGRNRVEF